MARTLHVSLLAVLVLSGCVTSKPDRAVAAQKIFSGAVQAHSDRQFDVAATGYERILRQYRDQPAWCAQALRSLGNVRAAQNRLDAAVQLYRRVGEDYRQFDWEVLQAWKSAGDLLWDAGRPYEAGKFYRQIVTRFDQPDAPAVVKTIVRTAQLRQNEKKTRNSL